MKKINHVQNLLVENVHYSDAIAKYKRTVNGVNIYEGKIKTKRGKKLYSFWIYHSQLHLVMRVQEGLKKLDFETSDFKCQPIK